MLNFIPESFLIVIPVLVALGAFIKNTNLLRDEFIPALLGVFGVALCSGIAKEVDVNTIMQGILCAATAVYGNQNIKQLAKVKEER